MGFRLKAFGIHLAVSCGVLTIIFGTLYAGWYRWPGWFLADVVHVVLVMAFVDVVLGPLLTFVVAAPSKPRRELARDITIIALAQIVALGYGSVSLWNGRPLYYAFSENVLQLVQAYDIEPQEWQRGEKENPTLAPTLFSTPRWIWAPLPQSAEERSKIVESAVSGGYDVITMPRYFKPWAEGLTALRGQLKTVDNLPYFTEAEKRRLKDKLRAAAEPADAATMMTLTGRGHWLMAVIDPVTLRIKTLMTAN